VAAAASLALALLVLARERLPPALRAAVAAAWMPVAAALRRAHSGRIGDSIAWLAVGTSAFGAACWLL
ncbi:MAG TPA: hypothetical protein VFP65_20555, partial [Anaeromyxobacteraceae bacterium]|nr:hypothetical protein [Anaeromyxobacteraceae bacterium]